MSNRKFTNGDVMQHGWAQCHRAGLLRTLHAGHMPRIPAVSRGWGTDVTGNDPRSVRVYLAAEGDLRNTWWSLYSAVYMTVGPVASLERAIYSFHHLHHALTLSKLAFAYSAATTAADIEQKGILAAVRNLVVREMKR